MKVRHILGWVAAGLFAALGAVILFGIYGFSFSAYICFGISAVLICYQLLALLGRNHKKAAKLMRLILSTLIGLGILASMGTVAYINKYAESEPEPNCEYVIVLGAGLRGSTPSIPLMDRLNTAAQYLKANPETVCVVSGGQGPGEHMTEAQCMYNILVEKGIDPARILMEPAATSTHENLVYSLEVIRKNTGQTPTRVGIVSNEFHIFRAVLMARDLGLEPMGIPAATSWDSLRVNYTLREIPAVWKYLVLGD